LIAPVIGAIATAPPVAPGVVELRARDPEVEEDGVHPLEAGLSGELGQVAEVAVHQRGARFEPAQQGPGRVHRAGVTIDGEQAAARLDRFQEHPRMAAGAQGAVNGDCPRPGLK